MLQAGLRAPGKTDQYDTYYVQSGWLSRIILIIGILVTGTAVAFTLLPVSSSVGPASLWATISAIGTVLALVTRQIAESRMRARTRETRQKIDQAIQGQSAGTTVDEAVENVVHSASGSSAEGVRKRFLSAVLDTTGIVAHADALVFHFLPDRPRAAKRLLNQVRLMILIATGRGYLC